MGEGEKIRTVIQNVLFVSTNHLSSIRSCRVVGGKEFVCFRSNLEMRMQSL